MHRRAAGWRLCTVLEEEVEVDGLHGLDVLEGPSEEGTGALLEALLLRSRPVASVHHRRAGVLRALGDPQL